MPVRSIEIVTLISGALEELVEDVVSVLESRPRLPMEFQDETDGRLKRYLSEQSQYLLGHSDIGNYLPRMITEAGGGTQVLNSLRLLAL